MTKYELFEIMKSHINNSTSFSKNNGSPMVNTHATTTIIEDAPAHSFAKLTAEEYAIKEQFKAYIKANAGFYDDCEEYRVAVLYGGTRLGFTNTLEEAFDILEAFSLSKDFGPEVAANITLL